MCPVLADLDDSYRKYNNWYSRIYLKILFTRKIRHVFIVDPLEHQVGHEFPRAVAQTSVQDLNLVNFENLVTGKAEY